MKQQKENPLWNILFNIILPVMILNKGHKFFPEDGHLYALLIALACPFFYGAKDYFQNRHINKISILGLSGTALTGGLALLQPAGIFFAVKEALIPLLIALFTAGSVFYKKPLMSFLIFQSSLFRKDVILLKLSSAGREKDFKALLNLTTFYLAGSFVLSAVLNFLIALWIFKDIDPSLGPEEKSQILNTQIADMTWMGYVLIALPLSLITGGIFWFLIKRLREMTGLSFNELVSSGAPKQ